MNTVINLNKSQGPTASASGWVRGSEAYYSRPTIEGPAAIACMSTLNNEQNTGDKVE